MIFEPLGLGVHTTPLKSVQGVIADMKGLIASSLAMLMVSTPTSVSAVQAVPGSGTMMVISLYPVVDGLSALPGGQMFEFVTDTPVSFTGAAWSCLVANPIQWFGVPKANPSPGGTGDNPSYRDHVNTLMLAYALNRPITLLVDGCVGGVPRVVNIQAF